MKYSITSILCPSIRWMTLSYLHGPPTRDNDDAMPTYDMCLNSTSDAPTILCWIVLLADAQISPYFITLVQLSVELGT